MALDPSTLLQEAVRAVPAVKYALGIAGILAVLAIAKAFDLDPRFAVGGTVLVLVLMVVLLVFARLSARASRYFVLPALFLTWGSLGLVLATAGALFSSAFFGRPIDLRPAGTARGIAPETPLLGDPGETSDIDPMVQIQLDASDYPAAWSAVRDARERQPGAPGLDALEVRVAEAWVRDMQQRDGRTFTELVDPLLPALYRAASSPDKQTAADALAHVGFASFLKNRDDGGKRLDPEASYRKALDLDPTNVYANALLGHWLLVSGKPVSAAQPYFEAALKTGRERAFVREYQIGALRWNRDQPGTLAVLHVCNDMRQHGELLDLELRQRIVSATYSVPSRELFDALEIALPPREHLATFLWLVEGMDVDGSAYTRFFVARLSEAAGDCAKALPIYEALLRDDTTLVDQIEAGVARCKKLAGAP
jgi:tetratricopeptide (TPR) repeat protein